ncbi:MAG: DUF1353 domain-containing protein [Rhizobiaceae bacterium]
MKKRICVKGVVAGLLASAFLLNACSVTGDKPPTATTTPAPVRPEPKKSPSSPGGTSVKTVNPSFGSFSGRLALAPQGCENSGGQGIGKCRVIQTGFAFNSPLPWKVRSNEPTDGASIPSFAWSTIGKPFDGSYLPAAIIHDNYCNHLVRPFLQTHRVFYSMLRALGVEPSKAAAMYAAVLIGGPKWIKLDSGEPCGENCIRTLSSRDARFIGIVSREGGLWRPSQIDNDRRNAFETLALEIRGGGAMELDAIDARVQLLLPEDPFLALRAYETAPFQTFANAPVIAGARQARSRQAR